MIRYRVSESELWDRIEKKAPGWRAESERRTDELETRGRWDGVQKPGWGRIKAVYVNLQHNKCAFCERQLEDESHGKIEWDVEHYRPKSSIAAWPTADIERSRRISYDFSTGTARSTGYHLLAFHPLNYAATCKICNTILKGCYFPIANERADGFREPCAYDDAEKPYLIYPIGDRDHGDNPEDVIKFDGVTAIPHYRSGHRHRLGQVIIDFFNLNGRDVLLEQRARVIQTLYMAKFMCANGKEQAAESIVQNTTDASAPHASCAQCFWTICEDDPERANELGEAAIEYLNALSER